METPDRPGIRLPGVARNPAKRGRNTPKTANGAL
jgi:hypothetical protein